MPKEGPSPRPGEGSSHRNLTLYLSLAKTHPPTSATDLGKNRGFFQVEDLSLDRRDKRALTSYLERTYGLSKAVVLDMTLHMGSMIVRRGPRTGEARDTSTGPMVGQWGRSPFRSEIREPRRGDPNNSPGREPRDTDPHQHLLSPDRATQPTLPRRADHRRLPPFYPVSLPSSLRTPPRRRPNSQILEILDRKGTVTLTRGLASAAKRRWMLARGDAVRRNPGYRTPTPGALKGRWKTHEAPSGCINAALQPSQPGR